MVQQITAEGLALVLQILALLALLVGLTYTRENYGEEPNLFAWKFWLYSTLTIQALAIIAGAIAAI